jgi:hypothetical protein
LHDIKHLGLDQPGFFTDAHDEIAFGKGHSFDEFYVVLIFW